MKPVRIEPSWVAEESAHAVPQSSQEAPDAANAPEAAENIIEVRGLGNKFGSQVVHENLALNVRRGEVLAIIGGSGTGKSVLLRSIIGLQKPSSGEVKVLGVDMVKATPAEQAKVARHWEIGRAHV